MVDLPLPDGPSKQTNSPAATLRVASRRISTAPASVVTDSETSSSATLAPDRDGGMLEGGGGRMDDVTARSDTPRSSTHAFANVNTRSL